MRARVDRAVRRVGLLALGLTCSGEALEFLLAQVRDGGRTGEDALEALAVYLPDPAARARVEAAADEAGLPLPE
ncbi:MAG: hypothetical protein R3F59_05395 [Myxococcota bacterium]